MWEGAAMHEPRAFPWGVTPAQTLFDLTLIELAAHSWDLARATGRAAPVPEPVGLSALRAARCLLGPLRGRELFAPVIVVPPSSPTLDRLAAFLGRRVAPARSFAMPSEGERRRPQGWHRA
jgi:uncharacterized protein (TIGR03086 family)